MPAFYAHYKFGQMVKKQLPAKYQRLLEDYQDLYEIGLHGPDILFFYHPIIRHPITQIGVVIHHETGRVFFEHALTQMHRSAAEGDKMQKALWAYALGVVCHFALDASCHTYINHFEKTRRISHHEIEKEFAGKGYGDFKMAVGDAVAAMLTPMQTRFEELIKDKEYLDKMIKQNDEKAYYFSQKTLRKVKKKVGLTENIR